MLARETKSEFSSAVEAIDCVRDSVTRFTQSIRGGSIILRSLATRSEALPQRINELKTKSSKACTSNMIGVDGGLFAEVV